MNPGKGPGSPRITLTVKSTSGSFNDEFNRNNPAQKVYDEAIKRFGLNKAGVYILKRESDGRVLALDQKLEDLGLQDGDVILIQSSQAEDG
ncbi:MAG: hypothetical protein ACTHO8_07045 [Solirubrobacterales bacterium]